MKITIQGTDYTAALDAQKPMTIVRKLNAPSVCELWLSLEANSALAAPQRNQSLIVAGDNGTVYFTGYIAVSPLPEFAGMGLVGPRYRTAIQALSDEVLLDQLLPATSKGNAAQSAGQLLTTLVKQTGTTTLNVSAVNLATQVGSLSPEPGANFSAAAAQIASDSRAAYRAANGALTLQAIPGAVHALSETDGSLNLSALSFTAAVKRALANDITVCGEHEPAAYVTEYFLGDGATTTFYLSDDPWFPPAAKESLIREHFNEPAINTLAWSNLSGAGYLTLGAGGLQMNGGNGFDGQTVLSWLDQIEMGGTLLLESTGVSLSPGSTGVVNAFYSGALTQAACIAGFQVTAASGGGAVSVQPFINGVATGTAYPIVTADQYALRVRINAPEVERQLQLYHSFGDSGVITTGGQSNTCGGRVQMEIQPYVDGVAGLPITLYDGAILSVPSSCTVVAASGINLIGSVRAINLTSQGTGWVVSTPSGSAARTRRTGTTAQGAECHLLRTGKLTFYTGFAPAVGEQVAISYRAIQRAVGREVNTASQASLAAAGSPAISTWIGSVTNPPARSSADCRNAAQAMQQSAASVSALWAGAYKTNSIAFNADVWPGDALQLTAPSTSLNAQVVVRQVTMTYAASVPDVVHYEIRFANDWADDLAIKTSATVPADTWLPATVSLTPLVNLNAMTVTALNGSVVTIAANTTPPTGGGFEVRLRDYDFMPGFDSNLVLRSTVPNLTFARQTGNDKFYIRMFDGATPPNYSEFSAALFINLPLGS